MGSLPSSTPSSEVALEILGEGVLAVSRWADPEADSSAWGCPCPCAAEHGVFEVSPSPCCLMGGVEQCLCFPFVIGSWECEGGYTYLLAVGCHIHEGLLWNLMKEESTSPRNPGLGVGCDNET